MIPPSEATTSAPFEYEPPRRPNRPRWSLVEWTWFVIKNLIGWVLIVGSIPTGMLVPGPGGLPMFLIGFGLISFPRKRHLTARVLRGMPVSRENRAYRWFVAAFAVLAPAGALSFVAGKWIFATEIMALLHGQAPTAQGQIPLRQYIWSWSALLVVTYLSSVIALWTFGLRGVHLINLALKQVPKGRRKIRPWLRRKGMDLLPPRRRRRLLNPGSMEYHHHDPDEGILEIHERHHDRIKACWKVSKPWLYLALRVTVVVLIFTWMIRPIYIKWDEVKHELLAVNWLYFALAAGMFSVFLFVFRALLWRQILSALGHRLGVAPAARVWSMSELARYVPGVIWQVVGRVMLTKPYGVPASVSSASQFLELAVFMLSNILLGLAGMTAAGVRKIPADERHWLYIAMGFVPLLLVFLHPKVFYGLLNAVMRKIGQPTLDSPLQKREIASYVLWTIIGLLWQSLAIWLLTYSVLGLPIGKWYVLAGAYCLAWTMGFSVGFLSPGGIGVRELVFISLLKIALPNRVLEEHVGDPSLHDAFLGFVGVLLRLWAIAGELMLAAAVNLADRNRVGGQIAEDAPLAAAPDR